ncbi:trimeric intracellular cation channel family protein [Bacillus fonticola]|uniref:trimeric intracellular cation channel family protein n=1 Tax=Bacillus fonticola TaxID=2728853 RepID=UPI001473965B|nr:trimeric intracellular cation channel family protein [Bacillus fonticola]
MAWEMLNLIGTVAFAISGAFIAIEEEYDLFGIYILGIVTAFGGGAIRNLLLGIPVSQIWEQGVLFTTAFLVITVVILFPYAVDRGWRRWGQTFDAVGLSAFAIQGALYASQMELGVVALLFAAVLTGCGGGLLRDVLAGRKPLVFRDEIYALWAALAGIVIGFGFDVFTSDIILLALFVLITVLRIYSFLYKWRLPSRNVIRNMTNSP